MTDVEILMKNGCTKTEAENHLKNGSTIFTDFEENFTQYMDEWGVDEEEREEYKQMIEGKKILPDWGIVKDAGKVYYIAYCL